MAADLKFASEVQDALAACGRGELAPNMALMRLIMAAANEFEVEDALHTAAATADPQARQNLQSALVLWRETAGAFGTVKSVLRSAEPGGSTVADWRRAFDEAARVSPEASVALYSLGRRDLLDAATGEIMQALKDWNALPLGARVLEIGCGIGRFMPALSRQADLVVGLDVSPAMLRQAAMNCPGTSAVPVQGSGMDLAPFRDEAFDLVLAIDSFPYIVAAGAEIAATHVAETARVLKPGGSLLVINYSYRGDEEADRRDVAASARETGLHVSLNGQRSLALWDGMIFRLQKPARDRNAGSRGPMV